MSHAYVWEKQASVAPLLTRADYGERSRRRKRTACAALCSVAIHTGLFFLLQALHVAPLATAADAREAVVPFRVERATVDPALLEPEGGDGGSSTENAAEAARETFSADDLEDLDTEDPGELLGRDLIATPGVAGLPPLPVPSPGASESAGAAIDALTAAIGDSSEDRISELLAATQAELVEFKPAAAEQPVVVTGLDSLLDSDAEDLFASVAQAATSVVPSGAEVPEGYASLDDLVAYNGPDIGDQPIMMPTDLLFGSDEDALRESAKASLMKLAFIVQKNPGATFTIEGHTDSFGSAAYNQGLSERRANAVRDWLVGTLQLDPGRFRVRGYGKARPIADTSGDSEAQSLNRRVEIVVTQDGRTIDRESVPRAEPVTPGAG